MKKLLIASILSVSIFSSSVSATELGFDMISGISGTSGLSVLSIVVSPILSSAAIGSLFKDLSATKTPIIVHKIEQKNDNRTYIYGSVNDQLIEFEAPTKAVKQANLKNNTAIKIQNAKIGYVLESNNVALGIVPSSSNSSDFKQNKLN